MKKTFCNGGGESLIHEKFKHYIADNVCKGLKFIKTCVCCNLKEFVLLDINLVPKIEHRFTYRNENYIADIACLDNEGYNNFIIEIFNTHRTQEIDRPEPWVELKAQNISSNLTNTFNCERIYKCNRCLYVNNFEKHKLKMQSVLIQIIKNNSIGYNFCYCKNIILKKYKRCFV